MISRQRRPRIFGFLSALASLFMVVCINNCCPDISGDWDVGETVEVTYPDPVCNSYGEFLGEVSIAQPQCMQVPCEFAFAGIIDMGTVPGVAIGTGTIDQAGQIGVDEFEKAPPGCTSTGIGAGIYDEETDTMAWHFSRTVTCPDVCGGLPGDVAIGVEFWRPPPP